MNNIKSYIILNRKTNLSINLFIIISILIFISLTILSQVKYNKYYQTMGQVIRDENQYYLLLLITPYQLNVIKNNKYLFIENKKYNYYIGNISNEYIISNDNNNYLKVTLDIDLKKEDKIENNILKVKVLESNKKIFYHIKDYFMRGVKR